MTYDDVRKDEAVNVYIKSADEALVALGYTEHSFVHVTHVARTAGEILEKLGHPKRVQELAMIAGHLHDIGNLINRVAHAQSGALMAFHILGRLGFDPKEIATITSAIGNHDEATAVAVNPVAAALILADKTDVRRSRVRNQETATFDIHDRVNYSVRDAALEICAEAATIELRLDFDTKYSSVMDWFEIFIDRMSLCRKAAKTLGLTFQLTINGHMMM